jgi:hypothetical protein
MNAKELADKLHCVEYGKISHTLCDEAKENGLVIVYGASDDLMEFRGAVDDELDCYGGGTAYLNKDGLIENRCSDPDCPYFHEHQKNGVPIAAVWGDKPGTVPWSYRTPIQLPHETFSIMEDDVVYCQGIVFALADVENVEV